MSETTTASPAERLTASRERLRQALRDKAAARGGNAGAGSGAAWWNALKSVPGTRLVVEALQGWWKQHPLHATGTLVGDALQAVVRPMARRHPLGLVVGALLVGGLLVSGRAWRWILTPTLLAGLVPQLLTKAVALVPAQSWLAVLDALARGRKDPVTPTRSDPVPPDSLQRQTH